MEGAGPGGTGNGEPGVVYTMENKPIVTCAGDQSLFTAVYSTLTQQLPREPMEWRRAYGRAPKMIHLESNFVQFKEELLPKEGNKALLTFPFLHIYWTECCDTEVYKATTKDDITKWQNALRAHSTTDWLIVVVESESKKKNKTNILPRTSIADKIRSDFCNKQSDRCMVLVDPLKDTSRSQESWSLFLSKLRTLLLTSFTRNLGHFEDEMRTLREKRTEPGWSFCDYFMVQEELAFVFEMLQQFEDALVQYDELDALFSQYVLNFGAGDGANWLSSFCQPVQSWDGLALRKPIDMEKRDLIQRRRANLLELRSYLFSRQCTLLLFLQRPWEVAGRALELLHNCVQELRLLEVSVPPGALDCWVFLSCLEVLQRIEGCCERAQLEANISHTVGLWSYATEKLQALGSLCGLVSESGPCSEDLQRTVDLLAGLGAERPETANTAQSPYKKLQEALSSEESFEKHYLDLAHATIEMYNSIGRSRSAKLVGKNLADFYMKKSLPQKAEPYLQGALRMYQAEGWALPLTHTRKQLAECQKLLGQTEPYLKTCSLLATDNNLPQEERVGHCHEILRLSAQDASAGGNHISLPFGSFAHLTSLRFDPPNAVVHVGGSLSIELALLCLLPEPFHLEHLSGYFHYSLDKNSYRKTAEWLTQHKPAGGTVHFQPETPLGVRVAPPILELSEMHEKSPSEGGLVSTGVICRNVHMLLRAQDTSSSSPVDRHFGLSLQDGAHNLHCSNIVLQPGLNHVTFHAQAQEPGTYTLRQLAASFGAVELLLPHVYPIVQYDVYSQEPQLKVEPLNDCLLAGVPQKLKFTVTTGHYQVKLGDTLQLSNADAMPIIPGTDTTASIYQNSHGEASVSSLSIQRSDKITSISLPLAPPYHIMEFELDVVCLLPEGGRLMNGEIPRRGKEPHNSHSSAASGVLEQRVSVDCPWSIYSTIISLTFHLPLKAQYTILSSGTRKYIQVCVENMCDFSFQLSDSCLSSTRDLQFHPLHTMESQSLQRQQCLFYVWEVTWRQGLPSTLPCSFSVSFFPLPLPESCANLQPFTYYFHLEHFYTLYTVRAEILPPAESEFCKMGSLCSLEVCITRLCDPVETDKEETLTDCEGYTSTQLFYQVVDGGSNWAVCGRSSGVVLMPVKHGACHTVRMEVMPLFAGYLPYPDVQLFRYLPHHSHSQQVDADSWIENDSVSVEDPCEAPSGRSQSTSLSPGPLSSTAEQKGLPMPRLQPFHAGQIGNSSAGRQILVIPSMDDHVLEVNVT
ncbi:trafficking protein particle complex subunit 10 isoform X1 [Eleutherodactylus coqui]|uniref:trafficking protein particle complex subunit 10 isoform X1 n=1 Tax=Eleutherodactylus coqui TaxID=57060 RepID=UPI0034632909